MRPCRHDPIAHHPLFGRCIVSDHQHHGAAGSERRKGHSQGLAWVDSATLGTPMSCQCESYRSVLALGTVPGRLMSRSLRLMEEKEGQCEPTGKCCHQCHSSRAGAPWIWEGVPCRALLAPCGWRPPHSHLCCDLSRARTGGCSTQQSRKAPKPPAMPGTASLPHSPDLRQQPAQGETRGRAHSHGSGTWQGSGAGTTTPASLASAGGQLCTAACLRQRVMAAPRRGQGPHGAHGVARQHCSPSLWCCWLARPPRVLTRCTC